MRNTSELRIIFLLFLLCNISVDGQQQIKENPVWPRPEIIPVPSDYAGMELNGISLNGTWNAAINPSEKLWNDPSSITDWMEVNVPGRGRSGQIIKRIVYKKALAIPSSFKEKRIIIRFSGVSNAAKLWVKNQLVKEHWGSFMPWTCDITDFVTPGKEAVLLLAVDDSRIGLSAFVRGGGIQRDVQIFAVPQNHLVRFQAETDLDSEYRDGIIRLWLKMNFKNERVTRIRFQLSDMNGLKVAVNKEFIDISPARSEVQVSLSVKDPLKWDAEHPNLYMLNATIMDSTNPLQTLSKKIGFRKIEISDRRMLVNGLEVKFRGIWGGDNVRMMKEANINHTRQKWATEAFLDSCDKVGIYVLDENPVDFARSGAESDPKYTYQWLSLISDLIERDRSHPSVIMWGLGNESQYGENILKTFIYSSAEDPSRASMFSWSHRIPADQELPYSIYSYHYPNISDKNLDPAAYSVASFNSASLIPQRKVKPYMPVLADEYCHLVISATELDRDPNARNFWGESILRFWEKMFPAQGCLGGDLFGLRADYVNDHLPEYWLIKKAYSPIRLRDKPVQNPGSGKPLTLSVKNWFDHTSLNEIKILWSVGNESGSFSGPDIKPHKEGRIQFPQRNWQNGDMLNIKFLSGNNLIDEYKIPVSPQTFTIPVAQGPAPDLSENEKEITVSGEDFKLIFDRYKGQISSGSYKGTTIISGGPDLQLTGSGPSKVESLNMGITARKTKNEVIIEIYRGYGNIEVRFEIKIDGRGLINTRYTILNLPDKPPLAKPLPWDSTHIGGFSEVGVFFELIPQINRLSWEREGLWSVYPEDHIGRNKGIAIRESSAGRMWAYYDTDPRYYGQNFGGGLGTNDFRSMKEYIYYAAAFSSETAKGLCTFSNATNGLRMEVQSRQPGAPVRMIINNEWNYPTIGLGNYMKDPILIGSGYSNSVIVQLKEISKEDYKLP